MTHELFRHVNVDITIDLPFKINIVACQVDRRSRIPFLLFLLEKEKEKEKDLSFPFINGPVLNMRCACGLELSEFENVEYIGYVIFKKQVYAFVSVACVKAKVENRFMCLVDEVLNYQSMLNSKINDCCIEFLFSNKDYYTLYSGKKSCEIPYVGYITTDNVKQMEIDDYFGPTKYEYDWYVFEPCDTSRYSIRYAIFNTTPTTINGKTRWLVRTLDSVISLSSHRI